MRRPWLPPVACAALASACLAIGAPARAAEPMPFRAERLPSPGRSTASEDGVEAIRLNPANVAWSPAAEARWTGVRCEDTKMAACGHAFAVGTPLFFDLSTGLRFDYAQPPWTADAPLALADYAWLTWALALRMSESVAVGMSLQRSFSANPYVDALWASSIGLSYRPNTHFAFSAVVHDWNDPSSRLVPPRNLPTLDRSYVFALAFRPTGRRVFEVGAEVKILDGSDLALPRATVGLDVPRLGRLRGDVEVARLPNDARRGVLATAGLEIAFSGLTVGGGALFGAGLGNASSLGQYATASIAGYRSPGVARPARAVTIRMERGLGPRSHVHLLRRLWKLAEDSEVDAVAFVLRTEPVGSWAHAEELADAIRLLRARGKKVLCSLEDNGARSLYVCSSADRIVVNPAGGLRYAGLRTQYFYLAGLLEKIGVRAEFVRIGAHKSAPEQFTNEHASDVARADHEDYLHQVEGWFNANVARGRHLTVAQVKEATAKGPFVASEAKDVGFVDGFAFDDEVDRALEELVGRKIHSEKLDEDRRAPDTFGVRGKVGIVYVDGDMVDGRSQRIPILDMKLVGSYTVADAVKQLRDDSTVKAVVLRVETPGGSSMAADVMWRELQLLAQKKPLIVSMGSAAASGGYYISSPGHTIYASPLTLTGSIGVFYGKADVSGLLGKLGVNVETYKTTPRADAESFFRPFTDDERRELERKVGQFYDTFLDRVSRGRNLPKAVVHEVAQGRVWTGAQAKERKLVDKLGGIREALAEARQAGGLPDDAPIVELPEIKTSLFEQLVKLAGFEQARVGLSIEALPPQLRDAARAVAPMAVYTGETPLARLEWAPVEPRTFDDE